MAHYFDRPGPLSGLDLEYLPNECLVDHIGDLPELVAAPIGHPFQLVVGFGLEGVPALGQREHDDPVGPDIGQFADVLPAGEYLGGHVVGRAADGIQLPVLVGCIRGHVLRVLNPKSMIFTLSPSIRIFCSLMSLCTMFFSCRYTRADSSWLPILRITLYERG